MKIVFFKFLLTLWKYLIVHKFRPSCFTIAPLLPLCCCRDDTGAAVPAGSSSKITEQNLKATDVDSDSLKIRYTLTKDPPAGKLQLSRSDGRVEKVSAKGPVQSFTQDDVNKGAKSRRDLCSCLSARPLTLWLSVQVCCTTATKRGRRAAVCRSSST